LGAQGYANAVVAQPDDVLAEQALGAFANIAADTAVNPGVVAQLSEVNSRLSKQFEYNAAALKEMKALLKKERAEHANSGNSEWPPRLNLTPSSDNYYWSHGYKEARTHTIQTCMYPKEGHKRESTKANNMGGSQFNRD
jgi:hypothetical protein